LRLSLGFSVSFLEQARQWDPHLLEKFQRLIAHENVDLVCVEPYHSFIFYHDMRCFQERMSWARNELERIFGMRPQVAETTEMFMCKEIYHALNGLGFKAALAEGRRRIVGWRSPTYLYHQGKEMPLFIRHKDLSDDVGYRFSQKTWAGYPLITPAWVDWIKNTRGDFVFVGWDFETFGEHHSVDTGIFDFLRWLPGELSWRGVNSLTLTQAADQFREHAYPIDLPVIPTTWAGLQGDPQFFLGNAAQFDIFLLMKHAYHLARLTRDERLMDIALWLSQSDNLHLLQWWGSKDRSEAEVSSYFTPGYWWNLGAARIPIELQNIFRNFIGVAARYMAERSRLPTIDSALEDASTEEGQEVKLYAPKASAVA